MNLSKPSSSSSAADAPGLLYAGFNQNFGCFAVGLDRGFRIYNCDPPKEKMRKDEDGGIAIVEMLFRCNYLALVGGGKNPKYAPNKVIIWDDLKETPIVEMEFRNEVKNEDLFISGLLIQPHIDCFRIVVVLHNKVFVYRFDATPEKLHTFETIDNDKGLVALSSSPSHAILATPGRQKGHIQIIDLNTTHPITVSGNANGTPSTSLGQHRRSFSDHKTERVYGETTKIKGQRTGSNTTYMSTSISFIPAHTNKLSCLALNEDGSKCASASEKGTLIRVFDTASGKLLNELRRGVDRAEIYSIAFSQDSRRLCVSSDKGTVHVFNLYADAEKGPGPVDNGKAHYGEVVVNNPVLAPSSGNRQSSLSFMKDLLPKYFSSEWSFAHFKITPDCRCICGFGQESHTIIVICADGTCYRYLFDERGGECARMSSENFLKDQD
ncbi:5915_t:CDS:2 [Paraglomus brasilianum]|uniref:5915_t:CDS:1 n=1 Tax=Paraglomus brasilianum TaxID=144538 RepID=A0A9N9GNF0_9GLOM|nr:5915_t:CDS:2 [Paraglomus brasilianum]